MAGSMKNSLMKPGWGVELIQGYMNMKAFNKKGNLNFLTGWLMMLICLHFGCASSELVNLGKNVQGMSDMELLNYYHGIDERIKDIATDIEREDRSDSDDQEHYIHHNTFFIGGEGYGLIQKRQVVLDELTNREITP